MILLQKQFSDTPEPGFVPLDDSNFSYYIAVPTSLRVDPGYSKVTTKNFQILCCQIEEYHSENIQRDFPSPSIQNML